MLTYWLLFLWPAIASLNILRMTNFASRVFLSIFGICLVFIIGLRFQVGVDWDNYLVHLDDAIGISFIEALQGKDSAYAVLNWCAGLLGAGVWFVNFSCAIIFAFGLVYFCAKLPSPWLALAVSIPYISIVFAMNYTRQAAAFGLFLLALVELQKSKLLPFLVLIILAALFHKSAILLIPLGLLINSRNKILTFFAIAFFAVTSFVVFLLETKDALINQYISGEMVSDGAWIRVIMNAIPAVIFLMLRDRFTLKKDQRRIYVFLSFLSLLFIPLMVISPSSTAVDRVALFLMPIQLYIFSQLPTALRSWGIIRISTVSILIGYAVVMYVWFEFSMFSFSWLPYRFYPFEVN